MARPHVPQFGNWEGQQNVPYTVVFDKARQGRGGKMINPNDPQQIPELYNNPAPPPTRPRTEQNKPVQRPVHERKPSREGNAGRRADGIGQANRRTPSRTSIGSEHSIDRSPFHAQSQPKKTGRGTTPGRYGLKPRDDDELDRGATIPAFGGWDPSNPESGDGYTKMFNNAREEKHTGIPIITTETHDYRHHSARNNKNGHNKAKRSMCTIL